MTYLTRIIWDGNSDDPGWFARFLMVDDEGERTEMDERMGCDDLAESDEYLTDLAISAAAWGARYMLKLFDKLRGEVTIERP